MAKDMPCHFCETSEEPEIGVMLVSDLTGSGQLPFAVGLNFMEGFLLDLLETFAQAPDDGMDNEPEAATDEPEDEPKTLQEAQEALKDVEHPFAEASAPEVPTPTRGPSGRSRRGSSARAAENGAGASEKTTDLVDIQTTE